MQKTLQLLFKKNTLQEIDKETLQQFTLQYPYFPVGQFLLAAKLQENKNAAFHEQFQKTLIYFYNPLWLQYQLQFKPSDSDTTPLNEEAPVPFRQDADAMLTSSSDMIEDVVLHQETNHSFTEKNIDGNSKTPEYNGSSPAVENLPVTLAEEKDIIPQEERHFPIQAFHTIDYFASQGIKLSQEVQADDKLGKQLKSFTEWLKTMRRLREPTGEEALEKVNDSEIAQFADNSLEEKEVLTEAMAEVLIKQGKYEKAAEVYRKLSLLNPHKNAYFADKIEEIKQH